MEVCRGGIMLQVRCQLGPQGSPSGRRQMSQLGQLEVLQRLQAARHAIVAGEADVDQLIDSGNDLAQLSGLERINSQVCAPAWLQQLYCNAAN